MQATPKVVVHGDAVAEVVRQPTGRTPPPQAGKAEVAPTGENADVAAPVATADRSHERRGAIVLRPSPPLKVGPIVLPRRVWMSIVAIAILVAGSVMVWEVTRGPDPQGLAGAAPEPALGAVAEADPDSDASAERPPGVGPDASGDGLAAVQAKAPADDVEPTTAPGHFRRGTRHFMDGNLADAQARFEAAVALDPGYCAAHRALGVVHAARQNGRRSVEAYQRYLACSPRVADDSEIRRRIAALGGETSASGDR